MIFLRVHFIVVFNVVMAESTCPELMANRTLFLAPSSVVLAAEFRVICSIYILISLFLRFFLLILKFLFVIVRLLTAIFSLIIGVRLSFLWLGLRLQLLLRFRIGLLLVFLLLVIFLKLVILVLSRGWLVCLVIRVFHRVDCEPKNDLK